MMDGAREALARYSSSIDEDLALLRDGGVVAGSRQDTAVQVRAAGAGFVARVYLLLELGLHRYCSVACAWLPA
jgi:hypothetical protein